MFPVLRPSNNFPIPFLACIDTFLRKHGGLVIFEVCELIGDLFDSLRGRLHVLALARVLLVVDKQVFMPMEILHTPTDLLLVQMDRTLGWLYQSIEI